MEMKKQSGRALAKGHQPSCCGTMEQVKRQSNQRRDARGQPWVARKLMVAITLGIMAYAVYVYVGTLTTRMIRRQHDALAGRKTGIVLLVFFSILFLWMMWAYIKVVITPPGYARDHIAKEPQPLFPPPRAPSWQSNLDDIELGNSQSSHHPGHPSTSASHHSVGGPPYEGMRDSEQSQANLTSTGHPPNLDQTQAGVLDSVPTPRPPPLSSPSTRNKAQARAYIARRPSTTPVLLPEHRYCARDEIVKPFRTHHCRNCGTCILKYDHHCPWIGQCVGARNHKFFVNFVQSALVFATYTLATLIPYVVRAGNSQSQDVDPQHIVIIALAALFALFTATLFLSHIHLICTGMTTVEHMQLQTSKDRESRALSRAFHFWEFREKRQMRKQWDREWGAISTEGNIWWLGSARKGWEDVMGTSKWGWFLPIGRSLSDGLTYPVNPRFDEQGRLRRRVDWPSELR